MNPFLGLFVTGAGGLIGLFVGYLVFDQFATPDPACIVPGDDYCLEVVNLSLIPFVGGFGAVGGAIGLIVEYIREKQH